MHCGLDGPGVLVRRENPDDARLFNDKYSSATVTGPAQKHWPVEAQSRERALDRYPLGVRRLLRIYRRCWYGLLTEGFRSAVRHGDDDH